MKDLFLKSNPIDFYNHQGDIVRREKTGGVLGQFLVDGGDDIRRAQIGMAPEDAAELVNAADEKAEDLVSLHDFTQLLHNNLDEREKATIVGLLWQVAYADGRLDKYEDSLVLKISDLLHVSRGRVMRLKHDAERVAEH